MDAHAWAEEIMDALYEGDEQDKLTVQTYEEAGVLSNDAGLVIRADGEDDDVYITITTQPRRY